MKEKTMADIFKNARDVSKPFRVTDGKGFRLKDINPRDTLAFKSEDKPREQEALATGVQALSILQDMLYAQDRWGVLLIFQGMDAAGKDSAIKHVMSGVNPQGVDVYNFRAPNDVELYFQVPSIRVTDDALVIQADFALIVK